MDKTFDRQQSLLFTMKPLSFEKMGDKLIRVSCYLLGVGINRNMSNITKDAISKANEKLAHLPVVGHLILDEKTGDYYIGGHDVKIEDKGRDWTIEPLTVALGCVAGDKKFEFVTLKEFEGTENEQEREYLKVDMIVWNHMSPVFEAAYSKDVYFNHSIEIDSIDGVWDETNNFRIDSFEYSKACLLGLSDDSKKHVEPCFPESKVYPTNYSLDQDFNKQLALLKQEIQKFNLESETDEDVPLVVSTETGEMDKTADKASQKNTKEGEELAKKTDILFSDVCAKIKLLVGERTYRCSKTGKQYDKYCVLSISEKDSSFVVVDRESDYSAFEISYIPTQTGEGLSIAIDYDSKKEMVVGAVEKTDAVFDVSAEIKAISKDVSDYDVSIHTNAKVNDLTKKLDDVTKEFEDAQGKIKTLEKQIGIFETEKKAFMQQKHKDVIDALVASRRDEMGKDSDFLEYCLEIDYSKTVETIEKDLKEIHYNFMVKNAPKGNANFSAIETDIPVGHGKSSIEERYGAEIAKYFV